MHLAFGRVTWLAVLAVLGACYRPPGPVAPRTAMPIIASQAQTWDAVIDVFAERNIPIRTMERASGFVATDRLRVSSENGLQWADCGTNPLGTPVPPYWVLYNVLVRGDSTESTVKVTADWTLNDGASCSAKGVWETDMEKGIKARAERR